MNLIETVIEQIREDLANNDTGALEELLKRVSVEVLRNYLPEG